MDFFDNYFLVETALSNFALERAKLNPKFIALKWPSSDITQFNPFLIKIDQGIKVKKGYIKEEITLSISSIMYSTSLYCIVSYRIVLYAYLLLGI